MKSFRKLFAAVLAAAVFLLITANIILTIMFQNTSYNRPYRIEINRIALIIEENGIEKLDLSEFEYVTNVTVFDTNSRQTNSDYTVLNINDTLYRFDYSICHNIDKNGILLTVNLSLLCMMLLFLFSFYYIKRKILLPFERFSNIPYELSKGNLTAPVKEDKNHFFGRFLWGIDMLRETIEKQKQKELLLQKEKKTLLLSLSHDIKTPLSAIKLYASALTKGLYPEREKQIEIAKNINRKADEIENYTTQIITAAREDFLNFDVTLSDFYLSQLIHPITEYYQEKLALIKTKFSVKNHTDCLINGDKDRSIEVLQNIMENAIKYGDGREISISISEEEGCILISVANSGCTLADNELPHIFESFWRGSNAGHTPGSGLGLSICRQLMNKMNGEIFAAVSDGILTVTAVFCLT